MLLQVVAHLRSISDDLIEDAGRFAKMRDFFCCHPEASQGTSPYRPVLYLVSVCDSVCAFPRAARKFRAIGHGSPRRAVGWAPPRRAVVPTGSRSLSCCPRYLSASAGRLTPSQRHLSASADRLT